MKNFFSIIGTFLVSLYLLLGVVFSQQVKNVETKVDSQSVLKKANTTQIDSLNNANKRIKKLEMTNLSNLENEEDVEVIMNGEIDGDFVDVNEESRLNKKVNVEELKVSDLDNSTEGASNDSENSDFELNKDSKEGNNISDIETVKEEPKLAYKLIKKERGLDDKRQSYVSYAYEKGGMALVTLIECENSQRSIDRKAGGSEESYGFCQVNKRWHKNILNDSRFWTDWKWQIDKCYELMKGGTPFYGRGKLMGGKRCDVVVESRFKKL